MKRFKSFLGFFVFLVLLFGWYKLDAQINPDTVILTGIVANIKDYDPPIHIDRKHMHEVWLRKYTLILPGGKYRLYETLDTANVQDIKKGQEVRWEVELFGRKDVRGCIENMLP